MAITLSMAQVNAQDDVDFMVIDNLRRYSWLLDQIVFDDTATPGTGGGSLVYGYTRIKTARDADFRAYNSEFSTEEAERERKTVALKPLGGNFPLDRALANLGPAASNETSFQMQQLLTSVRTRFQDAVINGDEAADPNSFDGLDESLTGGVTEYTPDDELDMSLGAITEQADAHMVFDIVDDWLSSIVPSAVGGGDIGEPGALPPGTKAILGNTKAISRLKSLARWAAIFTEEKDDLGRKIMRYGDWVLVDVGDKADASGPIIPTSGGTTSLYAVTFGMDSFHGASSAGMPLVQTWMPDRTTAGAVKNGEIEMGPVAVVLRNEKSAGVLRDVRVEPEATTT